EDGDGAMTGTANYASSIDLFGLDEDGNSPIALQNEYLGYCFVSFTEPLQVEQYGLSIDDNNVLTIANMPSDATSIQINVKVTALGLNGSVMSKETTITINQKIASDIRLDDKAIVLAAEEDAEDIRWNIADLKFNNIQLNKFVQASANDKLTITLTREDKEGKYVAFSKAIYCYDADGEVTDDYKEAVTFGFSVNGETGKDKTGTLTFAGEEYTWEQILPKNYTITLVATEGSSQFFTADATLKVSNPTAAAIKLVAEFVENKTLQAVGVVDPTKTIAAGRPINYDLLKGIVKSENVTIDKYIDVDYENYVASGSTNTKDMASQNWFEKEGSTLTVYAYDEDGAKEKPAQFDRLDKTRNIRIEYHLFDNAKNKDVFEFPIVVKSAVYSATPEKVITMTEDKLSAVFGGANNTNLIKVADITKAVLAAGPDKGKEYQLFNVAAGDPTVYTYNNYGTLAKTPVAAGANDVIASTYVVNDNGLMIEIELSDLAFFNYTAAQIMDAQNGKAHYYLPYQTLVDIKTNATADEKAANTLSWNALWNSVKDLTANVEVEENIFETQDLFTAAVDPKDNVVVGSLELNTAAYNAIKKLAETNETAAANLANIDMFKKYADKIPFKTVTVSIDSTPKNVDSKLLNGQATIDYVDKATGEKFATISGSTIKAVLATGVSVPGDEVEVPFKLTINDAWGKTMVYQFTATFTTK
ncbi:MAG: hypothetical protein Q4D36_08035, partial [Bacteroidales bacterium]|nr:hypothetical protein [Bacteroidales bacterium]